VAIEGVESLGDPMMLPWASRLRAARGHNSCLLWKTVMSKKQPVNAESYFAFSSLVLNRVLRIYFSFICGCAFSSHISFCLFGAMRLWGPTWNTPIAISDRTIVQTPFWGFHARQHPNPYFLLVKSLNSHFGIVEFTNIHCNPFTTIRIQSTHPYWTLLQ
jgi:hypothetical protein